MKITKAVNLLLFFTFLIPLYAGSKSSFMYIVTFKAPIESSFGIQLLPLGDKNSPDFVPVPFAFPGTFENRQAIQQQLGIESQVEHILGSIDAVIINMSVSEAEQLKQHPIVKSVIIDQINSPSSASYIRKNAWMPNSKPYANNSRYVAGLNKLFVPEVVINGQTYIDAALKLKDNGTYTVDTLTSLNATEELLLKKINSLPCGQDDTLGRFSTYQHFTNGNEYYCIVKQAMFTVEGGRILSYLLVEKDVVHLIIDERDDMFRGCCNSLYGWQYYDVQFGYFEGDAFVQKKMLSEIDFNKDYILQLTNSEREVEYY